MRNLTAETAFSVLAMARRLKAQGKDVVELEIGDSPFPSTPNAKRAGHPGDRGERDGLLPEPGTPRVPPGGGAVRHGRVRLRRDGRERRGRLGGQAVRAVLRRGGARPGRRRPGLQPAVPDLRPQPRSAAVRGPCWCRLQVEREFRPSAEDVRRLPGHRPAAAGDLAQLAAQPDRRRGDPRGPGRDRRRGARHRAVGLLRRAVLPHGLGRQARVDPGRAGDARAHGGGLHLQQVVQHERLADRLRGDARPSWSTRSAS